MTKRPRAGPPIGRWLGFLVFAVGLSLGCAKAHYPRPEYPRSTVVMSADLAVDPNLREIERLYEHLVSGYEAKDVNTVLSVMSPDFVSIGVHGERRDYADFLEGLNWFFRYSGRPIRWWVTIRSAEWLGRDTVRVDVFQQGSLYQTLSGKARHVEQDYAMRHTWRRKAGVWRLSSTDSTRGVHRWVDGKPVDPSKEFDPDAPPYVPAK